MKKASINKVLGKLKGVRCCECNRQLTGLRRVNIKHFPEQWTEKGEN